MMRFCALALLLLASTAFAGPGHDHGDAAPATASAPALPRFEAQSDLFEVVGILNAGELSVFVDRFADNAPVLKAKVDIESGSLKATGEFHAEHGDYSFPAAAFQKPGTYPITLTITAGDDVDILAGNLVVPDVVAAHDHANESAWKRWLPWIGGGVVLIVTALIAVARARRPRFAAGV